ncbi:MAG: Trk system potassium transporter TrkA [Prevotellaceae bacterium]|jgi:trk system potassium uptake protein TrkA|nr:Trk system potassium transporter TrkA [Prevotellaceae bacterium]
MKIIICGAGEVGRYVAVMFSNENQEIILMDDNSEHLEDLDTTYDLMTKTGSPTSLKALKECNIRNALFVAVTPDESTNITSCMLAHSLGAKKTIARINNYEYLLPTNSDFFKRMGVDSLIYPETLAATEIIESLKRGWMREYRTFGNGELALVCIKVRENAVFLDKMFSTGIFNHDRYRIVALKRHNQTIIPKGSDEIKVNDIVYFICSRENIDFIRQESGKEEVLIKNIIIMGGSRIAQKTVPFLPENMHVKIIERDRAKCYALAEKLPDTLIIHGDGRNVDLLKHEGIEDADAFVAVTGNSEANVLACLVSKRFGVKKSIAEVENIDYIDLAENLDIGTVVNKKLIAASRIYQLMLDEDALNVQCLTYSDAQVVEFVVKPGDRITRSRVRDLHLPEHVNIGGIIRDGKGFVVNGNTVVLPGDHVVIFCMALSVPKIARFF